MNTEPSPSWHVKVAVALFIITGLFPLIVGSGHVIRFVKNIHHPAQPWIARDSGPATYTLDEIRAFNTELATDYVLGAQVEFANLVNTGVMILLITIFGLRKSKRWAWLVLLGIGIWSGLNDLDSMLRAGVFPLALIPNVLGVIGLLIAYPVIFGKPAKAVTSAA